MFLDVFQKTIIISKDNYKKLKITFGIVLSMNLIRL